MDLAFLDAKPRLGRVDMIVEEEKNVSRRSDVILRQWGFIYKYHWRLTFVILAVKK